jgi:hypothetical protein
MSQHHDMFGLQTHHPEFKRRGGAVQIIVRSVGRYEIGDAPEDKEFAGSASKMISGETRESQHPITMIRGVCPASAK